MVSVSLTLYHLPSELASAYRANVYRIAAGERFIVLDLGGEATVTLDGYDEAAIKSARNIAMVLVLAADQLERERAAELCDCIASGNPDKPKQHGADPHAKNCRVYTDPQKNASLSPSVSPPDLASAEPIPDAMDTVF